jgi:hypothetical protein
MKTVFVEATNKEMNWGKFMLAKFDEDEWARRSAIDSGSLVAGRGWSSDHILVLDLQTGEGAFFKPGGYAHADLEKHKIWVCPLFEPFLEWLYTLPDPMSAPRSIDLPNAPFDFRGYRRPGPQPDDENQP